jgi:hypothetical protein
LGRYECDMAGFAFVTNCQADNGRLRKQRAAAGVYTLIPVPLYWLRGASRHNRLYASTRLYETRRKLREATPGPILFP